MPELYLKHGRLNPDGPGSDENGTALDDWGFNGPDLMGVTGLHVTYMQTYRVYFTDREAMEAAQALTGWEEWDDNCLEARFEGDCIAIHNAEKGRDEFFGDWGLQ